MRKRLSLLIVGLVCAPALAHAEDTAAAPAPAPDYTLSANVGIFSQYIYRGLTQTAREPAIQGGFDFSHKSGFYLGTWGSNISWFGDVNAANGKNNPSMEWDIYGGYKGSAGDIGYDVGALQYWYPGRYGSLPAGTVKPNTTEIYGALSYKWLSGKASYVVSDGLFGVDDARGSYYLDLSANYPIADTWALIAHVGYQKYKGNAVPGFDNDDFYSYTDWKLGISKDLGSGWSALAYYSDTNAEDKGYKFSGTGINDGKNLGAAQLVVGVSRSF
jgi:uncharacterized protein (TIGR02001 family)